MATGDPEVFIVDDDQAVRAALARLVAAAGRAVRTYGSAREFLDALGDLGPGCLVLDVRLPDLDGLELYRRLQKSGAFLPVIFMTGFGDIPMSVRAIKAGAFDFLTKPVEDETLLRAIDGALEEEARVRAERVQTDELLHRYESLTPREAEVMHLVLDGNLNKQIARELKISEKTVKVHRSRVMTKMGARRVAHLVHYAVRLGVVRHGADSPGVAPPRVSTRSPDVTRAHPGREADERATAPPAAEPGRAAHPPSDD